MTGKISTPPISLGRTTPSAREQTAFEKLATRINDLITYYFRISSISKKDIDQKGRLKNIFKKGQIESDTLKAAIKFEKTHNQNNLKIAKRLEKKQRYTQNTEALNNQSSKINLRNNKKKKIFDKYGVTINPDNSQNTKALTEEEKHKIKTKYLDPQTPENALPNPKKPEPLQFNTKEQQEIQEDANRLEIIAMYEAANNQRKEQVIEHKAFINEKDPQTNETVLEKALNSKQMPPFESSLWTLFLINNGAHCDGKIGEKLLKKEILKPAPSHNLIKKLIEKEVNINAQDPLGNTALHFAARSENSALPLLTTLGADPTIKNNKGETPRHIASKSKKQKTIAPLEEAEYKRLLDTAIEKKDWQLITSLLGKITPETLEEVLIKQMHNDPRSSFTNQLSKRISEHIALRNS